MFEFLLPVVQITLFCLCIGGDPRHLRMGVVNNETCSESNGTLCFSDLFLKNLDSKLIVQVLRFYIVQSNVVSQKKNLFIKIKLLSSLLNEHCCKIVYYYFIQILIFYKSVNFRKTSAAILLTHLARLAWGKRGAL